MKKPILAAILSATLAAPALSHAETLKDWLMQSQVSGNIRSYYFNQLIWMPPFEQVDFRCTAVRSKCCLISGLSCRLCLLALMKSAGRGLISMTSFFGTSLAQAYPSPV
uniref:Uncharacterized protein n=1 Tax=mine drainage metagenome TaxID=410659 RepID=E6QFF4_9ZZZZ